MMARHRLDAQDFLQSVTEDDHEEFEASARAAFDAEFDAERGRPGFAIALVLILAGVLLGAVWFGVSWLFGSKS